MPVEEYRRIIASGSSPTPEPSRVRGGTKAQRQGRSWESTVEALLSHLERQGRCTWWRTPEHLRRTRNEAARPHLHGGECTAIPVGQGPPDYLVLSRGLPLACEAKETTAPRWSFSGLALHQARALDAFDAQGGAGVILLRLQRAEVAIPWAVLRRRWWAWQELRERAHSGDASLGPEELVELGVPLDVEGRWIARMGGAS